MLLADAAAVYANAIYGAAAAGQTWLVRWLAGTVAYALQIYFDFSGYSDMAIGLARLFGIKFPCNFDSPYRADSIAEFWRRWHMSLTRFLRDYVYIPLGGNRRGAARQMANILVHLFPQRPLARGGLDVRYLGPAARRLLAAQTGVAQDDRRAALEPSALDLPWPACVLLTFTLVLFTWVFFRSADVPTAGQRPSKHGRRERLDVSDGNHQPAEANRTNAQDIRFSLRSGRCGIVGPLMLSYC